MIIAIWTDTERIHYLKKKPAEAGRRIYLDSATDALR